MLLELIGVAIATFCIYVYIRGIEYVVVEQRWIFVCLFLMPLSFIFDNWLKLRNWFVSKVCSAPKLHGKRVQSIQAEIKKWIRDGRQKKLCTGRPGWQTVGLRVGTYKATHHCVNINLMDILNLDVDKQIVKVEPLVTMGQLSHYLIKQGWTIPVLPELDVLTVGGLIMGVGIETSSHKHGLFQHTCVSYDIILADGELVHCSKDENADLFYQIPWSHGTLGFLVAAEIKIIPAKEYVKVQYTPVNDLKSMSMRIKEEAMDEKNDFVECLAYSLDSGVLMTAQMTDSCEQEKVNVISQYWKPWFFEHVKTYLETNTVGVEYIPLRDYYHRHTRSLFWELQDIIPFGNNVLFRYLFGWAMPPQIALLKITSPQIILDLYENKHVVQDMLVPIDDLKQSLECFDNLTQIYPLWLCPFKLYDVPGIIHPHGNNDVMYIDIGAYGSPKRDSFNGPATVKEIEAFVMEKKGFQMLYADSYLSREDFRTMFDHETYDKLRKKYQCKDAFPTIYDKVNRKARK